MNGAVTFLRWQTAGKSTFFRVVEILLAGVLLVAAVLKTIDPLVHLSPWYTLPTVLIELSLATWLISGVHPRYSWLAATVLFGVFSCVAAMKLLSGVSDCGCFGAARVSPWIALSIDICALIALCMCFPATQCLPRSRTPLWKLCLVAAYALFALYVIARFSSTTTAGDVLAQGITRFADNVVVDPDSWIGQRCPLIEYVDIGVELGANRWLVLLYHYDCPRCEDTVRRLKADAKTPVAMVSVPPHGIGKDMMTGTDSVTFGNLRDEVSWFVETPAVLILNNGIVESVYSPVTKDDLNSL